MMVLSLTDCPTGLRGDLTKWLFEVSAGVYVGKVNARVRDQLWDRIKDTCKKGRAVLVYNTNNEQGLSFRVHGNTWEPIDFDGLKLMLRPSPSRLTKSRQINKQEPETHGFSNAAKIRSAKRFSKAANRYPEKYVVIDVETTGLNPDKDQIIEIGALKVDHNEKIGSYDALIRIDGEIPQNIETLTGITTSMVNENGRNLNDVITEFIMFLQNLPVVAHNVDFDIRFLSNACVKCGIPLLTNRCIDTLALSRRLIKGLPDYKLGTIAAYFGIDTGNTHRSLGDCEMTWRLYEKLLNLMKSNSEK
jgi:CRISPR-associated protein Cas2